MALLACSITIFAYDFEVNDIYYNKLSDNTVAVEGANTLDASLVIPDTVVWLGNVYRVTAVADSAFKNATWITCLSIGVNVASIGSAAFDGCTSLSRIDCNSLLNMPELQDSLTFGPCYNKALVYVPHWAVDRYQAAPYWSLFGYQIRGRDYDIKQDSLYFWIDGIDSHECGLVAPEVHWFNGNLVVPATVTAEGETFTVITVSFFRCESLSSITLPPTIKELWWDIFVDCYADIKISDLAAWCGIEFSGPSSYEEDFSTGWDPGRHELYLNDEKVSHLIIPDEVTAIQPYSFYSITNIDRITIHDAVTTIGWGAFCNMRGLKRLTLGSGLTSIGHEAFACIGKEILYGYGYPIDAIVCKALVPPILEDNTCFSCYDDAILYVPASSLEDYSSHEIWGQFMHIVPFVGAGPGDVDGDGQISIDDVTGLIDQLLFGEELPAYIDVDGDGAVDINDVTTLIDMLLGIR